MRNGIGLAITQPSGVTGPDPAIGLFSGGEQGFYYNFSLLPTLFQDVAGTTPVTAATQPIGLAKDQSGRGNDGTNTLTARPTWQANGSALFDGVDDCIKSTFNPTASLSMAFRGSIGTALKLWGSTTGATRAYFGVNSSGFLAAALGAINEGTLTAGPSVLAQLLTAVVTTDGVTDNLYLNGVNIKSLAASGSSANAFPLYVGAINASGTPANLINGPFYKALAIARALTPAEVASITGYWSTH